jgi:hypothetical protein
VTTKELSVAEFVTTSNGVKMGKVGSLIIPKVSLQKKYLIQNLAY